MPQNHWEKLTHLPSKSEQIHEFNKKYTGCYLFLSTEKQKDILVYVQNVDTDNYKIYLTDHLSGQDYVINYDSIVSLRTEFPTAKLLNKNNSVVFVSRHPARQYRKAPTGDNFVITYPFVYKERVEIMDVIHEAYYPKYPEFSTAISELQKNSKVVAMAIDPEFFISVDCEESGSLVLWYIDTPISYITNKVFKPILSWKQEVLDFVRKHKLNYEVQ